MRHRQGFTLIEMMVTVALVAILASVAVPLAKLSAQRGKERELRLALREIRMGIDAFKRAGDEGHIHRSPAATGYPPTLRTLVEGAVDIKDPKSAKLFFLRRVPRDPFHPDPATPPEHTWGLRSYASEADQPREGDDVYDVHSRDSGTALDGTPYRQW